MPIRIFANWWYPDMIDRNGLWHLQAPKQEYLHHDRIKQLKRGDRVEVLTSGVYHYNAKNLRCHGHIFYVSSPYPSLVLVSKDAPLPILRCYSLSCIDSYSLINPEIQKVGIPYVHYIVLRDSLRQIRPMGLRELVEEPFRTSVTLGKKVPGQRRIIPVYAVKSLGNKKRRPTTNSDATSSEGSSTHVAKKAIKVSLNRRRKPKR